MEYTTLGRTGMTVSRLCLGCMSFGSGRTWTLDESESVELIEHAIDRGINFFDTANVYSSGESETILGNALEGYDDDRSVVSTKVRWPMDDENPNSSGLSRKTIEQELQNSLDRLGMDTVDIYHMHGGDRETDVEVTMRALDDLVSRGAVRYLGVSSIWAHELASMLEAIYRHDLEPLTVMQNHYNLTYREEERDVLPLCEKKGMGVIPYSPLARGFLARPHGQIDATTRGADEADAYDHTYHEGGGRAINERVGELADDRDVSMAQLSLAWLFHKDVVDAPIVGVSSIKHLDEAIDALEISLSDRDLDYLEEPYEPSQVTGI